MKAMTNIEVLTHLDFLIKGINDEIARVKAQRPMKPEYRRARVRAYRAQQLALRLAKVAVEEKE
jgi:hypothetical protein